VIVYWVTTNTWTILQQYVVRKRIGPVGAPATADGPEPAAAGAAARTEDGRAAAPNGAGGLGALIRGRLKQAEEPAAVGAQSRARSAPPPPPPRKKKKRSGRRR
jgi:YidC/Oxa1 family membrane protein insertase